MASVNEDVQKFLWTLYSTAPSDCSIGITGIVKKDVPIPINRNVNIRELTSSILGIVRGNLTDNCLGWFVRVTPLLPSFEGAGRGEESDSAGAGVLWVDLDLEKNNIAQQEAMDTLFDPTKTKLPAPTLIVNSGGGLHVYWKLRRFETDLRAIKMRNKNIAKLLSFLGADSCFDLSRVLRLPGTLNRKEVYGAPRKVDVLYYNQNNLKELSDFDEIEDITDICIIAEDLPEGFLQDVKARDLVLYKRMYSEESAKDAGALPRADSHVDRSKNDMWVAIRLFRLRKVCGQQVTIGMVVSALSSNVWFCGDKTKDRGQEYAIMTAKRASLYFDRMLRNDPTRFFDGNRFMPAALGEELLTECAYLSVEGKLWSYTNGVYANNGDAVIKRKIVEKLGSKWQKSFAQSTIEWITAVTSHSLINRSSEVLLNLANCMLKVTADSIDVLPHDPAYKSLSQVTAKWMSEVDQDAINFVEDYLAQVLPADVIPSFLEFIGTCLIPDYRFKKALLMIGPGDCGKSTLVNFISALLGETNLSSRSFQDLAGGNRFAKASLLGKLANVYADLPELEAKDVGQFKALTGNDIIDAEFKGRDAIPFRNYAKLIFSANNFPKVKTPDEAFFARWIVIYCNHRFVNASELQNSERMGDVCSLKDRNLEDKLKAPETLSAFLYLAVKGIQRLIRTEEFTASKAADSALSKFMGIADPVAGFILACTEEDYEAKTPKEDWYTAYRMWCTSMNIECSSAREFFMRMSELRRKFQLIEVTNTIVERQGSKRQMNCYRGRRLFDFIITADGSKLMLQIPLTISAEDLK